MRTRYFISFPSRLIKCKQGVRVCFLKKFSAFNIFNDGDEVSEIIREIDLCLSSFI